MKELSIHELSEEIKKEEWIQFTKDQSQTMGLNFETFATVFTPKSADDKVVFLFDMFEKARIQYDADSGNDMSTIIFEDMENAIFFLNASGIKVNRADIIGL